MINNANTIVRIQSNDLNGRVFFNVIAIKKIESFCLKILFNQEEILIKKEATSQNNISFSVEIDHPHLWSVNHPNLYNYELLINYDDHQEKIIDYFGVRKISTNGKYVCINNTPIFIKGYIRGATAHEHSNNENLSEEDFYRKNIRTAKAFGFNLVRFHSQIPSDTFFKVADEEGLLVHIEMRPPHDLYNNLEEMINSKADFISEDFILTTINRLYNHPSLLVYCLGNEIRNLTNYSIVTEIGQEIKHLDPTRLFIDTCAWGENGRPIVDIDVQHLSYYFPFGKHKGMYDDTKNLLLGDFNKGKEISFNVPLLAHEVCHYTALRDFKGLREKFIKNNRPIPWWVDEEIKLIHHKKYDDIYQDMYRASKLWQLNCWKIAFEEMRNSSLLGGFHFLQFADTDVYENSNGIVDCFDDINFIKPEQFLMFNGDIIVTAQFNKYNFYEEEIIDLPIYISRFDELNLSKCDLEYQFEYLNKNVVHSIRLIDISKHDHYQISSLRINFPKVKNKTDFKIIIKVKDKDKIICHNEYHLYIYPKLPPISYNEFVNYHDDDVYITNNIEFALELLKKDKKVCLVYRSDFTRHLIHKTMKNPVYAFNASWNRYKPVIWDRGTNFGIIENISKFTSNISNSPICGNDYCCLCEDSDKIFIKDNTIKFNNIISGIDKCNRDRFDAYKGSFNLPELMYDRTLRNYSYLFETKVDKGKLLVTGFNFLGLDQNECSSNNMAHRIIDYLKSSSFEPSATNHYEDFKKYLTDCAKAPVKERMMTQFWALDNEPVESKDYWIEAKKYLINN